MDKFYVITIDSVNDESSHYTATKIFSDEDKAYRYYYGAIVDCYQNGIFGHSLDEPYMRADVCEKEFTAWVDGEYTICHYDIQIDECVMDRDCITLEHWN